MDRIGRRMNYPLGAVWDLLNLGEEKVRKGYIIYTDTYTPGTPKKLFGQSARETRSQESAQEAWKCRLFGGSSNDLVSTLPPTIMVQWKMGPSNMSFLSFRVIFHFHDYGRKGN